MIVKQATITVLFCGQPLVLDLTQRVEDLDVQNFESVSRQSIGIHSLEGTIISGTLPDWIKPGDQSLPIYHPEVGALFRLMLDRKTIKSQGVFRFEPKELTDERH